MKPTTTYSDTILDNGGAFTDEFFRRFSLRRAPEPLKLDDRISKDYLFPTFYNDVTCAIGIFLCSYRRAAELVSRELHPSVRPVRMTRGRSLVAFSCYEYRTVMGVPPYNEIAMTIPVMAGTAVNIPILPMIMGGFKRFGFYVFDMPVTSKENQIRGNKIWGLPKVTREIDISENDGLCITEAKEESGESYFRLAVPTEGSAVPFDVSSNLYTRLGDRVLQSETNYRATFAVTKFMGKLISKNSPAQSPSLAIGNTPSAHKLRELEIENNPFQFRFARHMTSCFDLPDPDFVFDPQKK